MVSLSSSLYIGYLNNILKHVDGYKPLQLTNSSNLSEVIATARDIDDLSFLDNLLAYGESEDYFFKSYGFLYDPITTDALSRIKNSGKSPELVETIIENLGDLADEDFNLDAEAIAKLKVGNTFDSITSQFQEEYVDTGVLASFATFQDEDDLLEDEEDDEDLEEDFLEIDSEGYDFDDDEEEEEDDLEEDLEEEDFDYFANADDEDDPEDDFDDDDNEEDEDFDYFANADDDEEDLEEEEFEDEDNFDSTDIDSEGYSFGDEDDEEEEDNLEDLEEPEDNNFDYFANADDDDDDDDEWDEEDLEDNLEGVDTEQQRPLTQSDFIEDEFAMLEEEEEENNFDYFANADDEEDEEEFEEEEEENNFDYFGNADDEEDEEDNIFEDNFEDNEYPMDMDEEEDNYPMDMDDEEDDTSSNNVNKSKNYGNSQNNGEQDLVSSRVTSTPVNQGVNPSSVPEKTSNDKIASAIVGLSDLFLATPSKAKKGFSKATKIAKETVLVEDEGDEVISQNTKQDS